MLSQREGFEGNVFINCPFDEAYEPLLRTLLFTIVYCGLRPRISSERDDSGEVRVSKIIDLVQQSKYSIHDLSRMEPTGKDSLPRLNMPFELGIELGMRFASDELFSTKRCLVLEKDRYRYQRALSDLSGNDIKAYDGKPELLVRKVRNWLVENGQAGIAPPTKIWLAYNEFLARFDEETARRGFSPLDVREMPLAEFIGYIYLLVPELSGSTRT